MNDKTAEALGILQEECAEVIVEISKCRRFGLYTEHYKTGIKHSAMLETEVADMMALIDILVEQGVLDLNTIDLAKEAKKEKLKKWSKLYD